MADATKNSRTWIYGHGGLAREESGDLVAVLDSASLGFDAPLARQSMLAVHAEGGHLVRGDQELLAFDNEGAVQPKGRRAYALARLDADRWAIATREGREVVVRVGRRGAEGLRLRSPRELPKRVIGLQWRGGEAPFTRRKRFSETLGRLQLRGEQGRFALADLDAGIVALWSEGSMDWTFSARFPVAEGSFLDAHPFRDGVVVALCSDTGEGRIEYIEGGETRASVSVQNVVALAARGDAVYFAADGSLQRWVPGDAAEPLLESEYLRRPGEIACVPDGRFLFQENERTVWIECTEESWLARPMKAPTNDAGPMVVAKQTLPRKKGPPQLVLDAMAELTPWALETGEAVLTFPLVMVGGPGEELIVEVGGPGKSLFRPLRVNVEGAAVVAADFEGLRATLPCALSAGVEVPEPPKSVARRKADAKAWHWAQIPDDCRITLTLVGEAKKAGSALLTVRMAFAEQGRQGSLLRGQTLTVRDAT
ncbi:MAG: hypothetical protein AAF938_20605 [Myxococcota bacterium]